MLLFDIEKFLNTLLKTEHCYWAAIGFSKVSRCWVMFDKALDADLQSIVSSWIYEWKMHHYRFKLETDTHGFFWQHFSSRQIHLVLSHSSGFKVFKKIYAVNEKVVRCIIHVTTSCRDPIVPMFTYTFGCTSFFVRFT